MNQKIIRKFQSKNDLYLNGRNYIKSEYFQAKQK